MTAPRVIVSDDEAPLVRSLARLFRRHGVDAVEDSTCEVLRLTEELLPALVLVDLHQSVSGLELLRSLKANPKTSRIPVVIMSGDNSDTDRRAAIDGGAADYLVKPFGAETVRELAERMKAAAP